MNKSALALAVAAALGAAAAHAETTLYGQVRAGFQFAEPFGDGDSFTKIRDEDSRFGITGSEDLGNGLSAIYNISFNFSVPDEPSGVAGRDRWVGLAGGFGSVKLGVMDSAYYDVIGRTDVFNRIGFNYSSNPNTRRGNAIKYETPSSLTFLKGGVMLNFNGQGTDFFIDTNNNNTVDPGERVFQNEDHLDEYSAGVNFNFGGPAVSFGVGLGYIKEQTFETDAFGIAASVDFAGASIGVNYQRGDFIDTGTPQVSSVGDLATAGNTNCFGLAGALGLIPGVDEGDSQYFQIEGQYTFGNNVVRAAYGRCKPDVQLAGVDILDDADEFELGYQYNLSKRTRVWVEYQQAESVIDNNIDELKDLRVGIRHDF